MTSIRLRSIHPHDDVFLHTLMNHPEIMARLHQPPTSLADWEEAIQLWRSDPDEKGFIVLCDEQPIGWFAINSLLSPERLPYIKMAVLLPEYQNQGIGRRVLVRLCEILHAEGYPAVRLYTDQDNLMAQRCYRQSGFRIINAMEEPWPDGSTLLRYEMAKEL
ncbi:MAG: GNAT family N-acetyltransferase [Clostridiales bacterium]|nr:GNAT family N-acetyltransferase [Clostridiales bacterium]